MAAHRIPVGANWQNARYLNDRGIRSFMEKVVVEPFGKAAEMRHQELVVAGNKYIEQRPSCVQVIARGTTFAQSAEFAKWLSTDNLDYRATDEDLAAKFRANAVETIGENKVGLAIDRILSLEHLADLDELLAILV
jgi:hypothetical protein